MVHVVKLMQHTALFAGVAKLLYRFLDAL